MKQPEDFKTVDLEDIFIWPCGTWCYRYEVSSMSHKSDDYKVLFVGTSEYEDFLENLMGE